MQNKLWQKIRGLDGNLKYDIDEILDEQIHFYSNLFSTEGWDTNVAEELVTHMDKKNNMRRKGRFRKGLDN